MSFWKSKRCTKLNDKVIQMAHEEAVDWIYKYERKTLAIAKMSYYRSFNFDRDVLGKRRSETDDFVMIGALHEGSDAKRVHCEVRFTDHPSENDFVGDCTLTHSGDEGESHRRPLMVSVSIWDADTHWRRASYECLRDCAISGDRFCHFRISTEIAEIPGVLAQLRDRGYGPTVRLREFTMWPRIILPNAPSGAWNIDG